MLKVLVLMLFSMHLFAGEQECNLSFSTGDGGTRVIHVKSQVLVDVESYKLLDGKIFFAVSPIYGRPEIGLIDCKTGFRKKIISPKHFNKTYKYGADFFWD